MQVTDLIPALKQSHGEGNGNPLQYPCLENPMGRGAWRATVHGLARVGHNLVTEQHRIPNMRKSLLTYRLTCRFKEKTIQLTGFVPNLAF